MISVSNGFYIDMTPEKIYEKQEKSLTIREKCVSIFKQSVEWFHTSETVELQLNDGMRGWRNWQTRTFEVRVVYPWGFESPPSHQEKLHGISKKIRCSVEFSFCRGSGYCQILPENARFCGGIAGRLQGRKMIDSSGKMQ